MNGNAPKDQLSSDVISCLNRHVTPGQRVALGLSGGVDSIVLLHLLSRLQSVHDFSLLALHVHHGLSPLADQWENFCRERCEDLQISYISVRVKVDTKAGEGTEAAARRVRHAAFTRADANWIMLAHHRDDQTETVLFNVLRGCGLAGAGGMQERRGRLLRPLLTRTRHQIVEYAREMGLSWIEDESNTDERHTRNFLRNTVLPIISTRWPGAGKNIAAAASRFSEAGVLLDDLARLDLEDTTDFPLPLVKLKNLSEVRARNVLRYLLTMHHVMIPGESRLREAVRQFRTAAPDQHPEIILGTCCRLFRQRDQVFLEWLKS